MTNSSTSTTPTADRLRSYIERVDRLEQEKQDAATGIKDIYSEAKSAGFDPKTIRQVVKLLKIDRQTREADEALLGSYLAALGEV